ncbi:MAG: OB-fold domain-containing protein [Ottowia sp.]|uniref:Zn-ribbon domain-containing OB-fold protein n=1 Tax=Ottowia sp. TaxID=1898956 RepID=UPI003C70D1B3
MSAESKSMNTPPRADLMTRPLPSPDPDSQAYWAGLRKGVLLLQQCRACGSLNAYHQAFCRDCSSTDFDLMASCGLGTVHSFSVVHRAPGPAFKQDVPYAVLLVELDEGPRVVSRLVGADPSVLGFDMQVQLICTPVSDEISLPCFKPNDSC